MQAIQGTLWAGIKKVFPEFIHSYTKKQFKQKLFDSISENFLAINLDGSSWDSSQWPDLQRTEGFFLNAIKPGIRSLLVFNREVITQGLGVDID